MAEENVPDQKLDERNIEMVTPEVNSYVRSNERDLLPSESEGIRQVRKTSLQDVRSRRGKLSTN